MIEASVVVATYNRSEALARLLGTLAKQNVPRDLFEVVVVDDGSREDARPVAARFTSSLQIAAIRQKNSGVAVARERGVHEARGRIVIFLDDDMRVPRSFVAEHIAAHAGYDDRVVMGELLADEKLAEMPLFERLHAYQLEKAARRYAASGTFAGQEVYTANLSLPRELFLRVGGFDPAFFIEDVELGVRLERAGAALVFSRKAPAVHASDHTKLHKWLDRCHLEGRDWVRLARKHPSVLGASPWSFFRNANPFSRPLFAAAVVAPAAAPALARTIFSGALGADALGADRAVAALMTLVYGVQYYGGVRKETGSLRDALRAYRAYVRQLDSERAAAKRRKADVDGYDDDRPSGDRLRGPESRAAKMGVVLGHLSRNAPA